MFQPAVRQPLMGASPPGDGLQGDTGTREGHLTAMIEDPWLV